VFLTLDALCCVIAYPPSALGFGGSYLSESGFYAAGGVFDANGTATRTGLGTLFDKGELFTIADIGWAPDFIGGAVAGKDFTPGHDDYHLTFWHADERRAFGRPEGWGYTFSAQKGFGNTVGFARYGVANGGATPLRKMASLGLGIENVFGYEQDTIAIGLSWGEPSDRALNDQFGVETYYKMQLTPSFALTGNIQTIINPARMPASDTALILSLRGRFTF